MALCITKNYLKKCLRPLTISMNRPLCSMTISLMSEITICATGRLCGCSAAMLSNITSIKWKNRLFYRPIQIHFKVRFRFTAVLEIFFVSCYLHFTYINLRALQVLARTWNPHFYFTIKTLSTSFLYLQILNKFCKQCRLRQLFLNPKQLVIFTHAVCSRRRPRLDLSRI